MKVFINNKPLFFISQSGNPPDDKNAIFFDSNSSIMLERAIDILENDKNSGVSSVYLRGNEKLWLKFCSMFEKVEAAGGLVKNSNGDLLFIFRLGKWDFPKGKLEKKEKPEEAAIREVEEECGIGNLKITTQLPSTYHTYILNGRRKLKETHWFAMETSSTKKLHPQFEEDILYARWIKPHEIEHILKNTYNSIRDVFGSLGV